MSEKILVPILKKILFKRKINMEEICFAYSFERVMPGKDYLNSITSNFRCYSGFNEKSKKKILLECLKNNKLFQYENNLAYDLQ